MVEREKSKCAVVAARDAAAVRINYSGDALVLSANDVAQIGASNELLTHSN